VPSPVPSLDDVLGQRGAVRPVTQNWRWLVEWAAVAVIALSLAVVVRTFVAQMFFIPSGSMLPTLQIGERIVVDKLSYNFGSVERGDIVVFAKPPLEQADYSDLVKRVIGLPGNVISLSDGHVDINGRQLAEPWLPNPPPPTYPSPVPEAFSLQHPYRVPPGEYFVMGDNRTDSEDSRYFGPIPKSLIVGKMVVRVWPLDDNDAIVLLSVLAAGLAIAFVVEWRGTRRPPSRRPRHRRSRPLSS
jgi:signal peptidase I